MALQQALRWRWISPLGLQVVSHVSASAPLRTACRTVARSSRSGASAASCGSAPRQRRACCKGAELSGSNHTAGLKRMSHVAKGSAAAATVTTTTAGRDALRTSTKNRRASPSAKPDPSLTTDLFDHPQLMSHAHDARLVARYDAPASLSPPPSSQPPPPSPPASPSRPPPTQPLQAPRSWPPNWIVHEPSAMAVHGFRPPPAAQPWQTTFGTQGPLPPSHPSPGRLPPRLSFPSNQQHPPPAIHLPPPPTPASFPQSFHTVAATAAAAAAGSSLPFPTSSVNVNLRAPATFAPPPARGPVGDLSSPPMPFTSNSSSSTSSSGLAVASFHSASAAAAAATATAAASDSAIHGPQQHPLPSSGRQRQQPLLPTRHIVAAVDPDLNGALAVIFWDEFPTGEVDGSPSPGSGCSPHSYPDANGAVSGASGVVGGAASSAAAEETERDGGSEGQRSDEEEEEEEGGGEDGEEGGDGLGGAPRAPPAPPSDMGRWHVHVWDMPTSAAHLQKVTASGRASRRRLLNVAGARRVLGRALRIALPPPPQPVALYGYVEVPPILPGDGTLSAYTSLWGTSAWLGLLAASGFTVGSTPVRRWKTDLGLFGARSKDAGLELAKRLFPQQEAILSRKKDHGRGDALLIAAWAMGACLPPRVAGTLRRNRITLDELISQHMGVAGIMWGPPRPPVMKDAYGNPLTPERDMMDEIESAQSKVDRKDAARAERAAAKATKANATKRAGARKMRRPGAAADAEDDTEAASAAEAAAAAEAGAAVLEEGAAKGSTKRRRKKAAEAEAESDTGGADRSEGHGPAAGARKRGRKRAGAAGVAGKGSAGEESAPATEAEEGRPEPAGRRRRGRAARKGDAPEEVTGAAAAPTAAAQEPAPPGRGKRGRPAATAARSRAAATVSSGDRPSATEAEDGTAVEIPEASRPTMGPPVASSGAQRGGRGRKEPVSGASAAEAAAAEGATAPAKRSRGRPKKEVM